MLAKKQIGEDTNIAPGIYDIGIDDYHNSVGISRSGIMLLKKSPLHFWHKYINENKEHEKQTPDQIVGNAVHTYVLEPGEFYKRYYVAPKVNRVTNAGKTEWQRILKEAGHKDIIDEQLMEKVENIYSALYSIEQVKSLIGDGLNEKSIYWNDPETGLLCKCRPDVIGNDFNYVCDLKTQGDASYWGFQRSIYNYGYHIQAAMIQEGLLHARGKEINDFIFIAVEKEPPYAVGIYLLDSIALDCGKYEFKKMLKTYKQCLETNEWPSYPIEIISLPRYALTIQE